MFDVATLGVPALFAFGIPLYERFALSQGRDGLDAFVQEDERLVERGYREVVDAEAGATSLFGRVIRQLVRDLRPGTALIFIAMIVLLIVGGLATDDSNRVWSGVALAAIYAFMFASTVRSHHVLARAPVGEVTLVSLNRPAFLQYGMATLRRDDNTTFKAAVRWRPVEACRRRSESVRLLFAETPPDLPTFVGIKR